MTDNVKKKFILEASSDEEESITNEPDVPVERMNNEQSDTNQSDTSVNADTNESNILSSISFPLMSSSELDKDRKSVV